MLHEEIPPELMNSSIVEAAVHQAAPPLSYQRSIFVRFDREDREEWYLVCRFFPDEVKVHEPDLAHLSVRQIRDLIERLTNEYDRSHSSKLACSSWEMS